MLKPWNYSAWCRREVAPGWIVLGGGGGGGYRCYMYSDVSAISIKSALNM